MRNPLTTFWDWLCELDLYDYQFLAQNPDITEDEVRGFKKRLRRNELIAAIFIGIVFGLIGAALRRWLG